MRDIYPYLLQIRLQADFVMKAGLLVIILCAFIIYLTILYRQKKNRMHAERQLQEHSFNQELLRSKVEVQEATFNSLSSELHDNLGQLISTALMLVNMTAKDLKESSQTLDSASETLNRSIFELRSLSKSLNKDWLEKFELSSNLRGEISRISNSQDLTIELSETEEEFPLNPNQQFILFRIMQEALQNVVRHSNASMLMIDIQRSGNFVEVIIKDNGQGFNVKSKLIGLGITNMKQRAISIGANIKWYSNSEGTQVFISTPIKPIKHEV